MNETAWHDGIVRTCTIPGGGAVMDVTSGQDFGYWLRGLSPAARAELDRVGPREFVEYLVRFRTEERVYAMGARVSYAVEVWLRNEGRENPEEDVRLLRLAGLLPPMI